MEQQAFDGMERGVFREVSRQMTFVGVIWLGIGALAALASCAMALSVITHPGMMGYAGTLLLKLVDHAALAGAGLYTILTARKLKQVAEQQGDPITTIMGVFTSLGTMFFLYAATVGLDVVTDILAAAGGHHGL